MQENVGISKAASLLGVSPSTVVRHANNGKIDVVFTAGGQRRVPVSEINRLLASEPEDRAERARQQTQAAREAIAEKRKNTQGTLYTAEDVSSFMDEEKETEKTELLTAFNGYEVRLSGGCNIYGKQNYNGFRR